MSIAAIAWAFKQSVGNPLRKLILVKLADNANEDGYCWPSIDRIVRDTETSRDTVIRHIHALERDGILTVVRRRKDGVNLPNHYQLNVGGEGVVAQCDYPPQKATTSSTVRGGVVAECNPNRHIEPSLTTTTPVVVPSGEKEKTTPPSKTVSPQAETETVEEIMSVTIGTKLEGMIPESVISILVADYNPDAHPDYPGETAPEGIKRLIHWAAAQMSDPKAAPISNPVAFLRARAKKGMDKPAALIRHEQAKETERLEEERRRKARERIKIITREKMPEDVRMFIADLCGRTTIAGGTYTAEDARKIIPSARNVIPLRRQG